MTQKYEVLTDPYHNILRLNLYQFDGTPVMPLYKAMVTPEMLPTSTLNPTVTATSGATKATSKAKAKRGQVLMGGGGLEGTPRTGHEIQRMADRWWWFGVALTASGSVLYFFF